MRELVDGGAADASADGLDQRLATGIRWCIGDGSAGKIREAHRSVPAETGDAERLTGHFDVPPETPVEQSLHYTNPIGGVRPLRNVKRIPENAAVNSARAIASIV